MRKALVGGALVGAVLLAWPVWRPPVEAQAPPPASLGASVREGRLVVEGSGFTPGERVTVRVQTRGRSPEDAQVLEAEAVADASGAFAVRTDVAVPPVTGADLFVMYNCTPVPMPTATPAPTPVPGAPPPPRTATVTACERVLAASVAFAQAAPLALPRTGGGGDTWSLLPLALAGGAAGAAGLGGTGAALWLRRARCRPDRVSERT